MTPKNPYNAQRLFDQASRESMRRNGRKCQCEMHEQRVRVPTKKLGVKNVNLSGHGVVHLSSCRHSEMERTCWSRPVARSGRMRATVTIEDAEP